MTGAVTEPGAVTGRRRRPVVEAGRSSLAFWRAFYAAQARLIWEWRATRLAQARRVVLSFGAAVIALLIVSTLSPTLVLQGWTTVLLAGLVLTLFDTLTRPVLLLVLSPLPVLALQVAGLVLEILAVLLVGWLVPGVRVGSLGAAIVDGVALTILNAVFAEVLRAADDDSYHGTQVRRLAAREFGRPESPTPGLLMIQIDGLSLPVLEHQMRAGRMPRLARLVRDGTHAVQPWFPLLPPVTPASQAGILHGDNDDVPAFRWFDKATGARVVANTPEGAAAILASLTDGHGLLADDGASIGNLVNGDAPRSYLTMATIGDGAAGPDDPRRLHGIFVSQVNYIRLAVLTMGEVVKELYQRERQRGRGIEPRMHRDLHYALERALTNVTLRNLTTALVIEEMFSGAPSIYVDYTGYDALAHHVGPERAEAVDALDGLDRTVGSLLRVGRETPRPYRLVILSDHGQCLGEPFTQRHGESLEQVALRLIGDGPARLPAGSGIEYAGTGRMILGEFARGRGVRPSIARRAGRRRPVADIAAKEGPLVACASGSLALLYLTVADRRLDREEIDLQYPNLIPGLIAHPGVALVMVRSAVAGPLVLARDGQTELATGRVTGVDPLLPFGPLAAASLLRLDGFRNTGDLVVLGPWDERTGEVVSFEDLVGSHGGLGGWQVRPFLLHPVDLPIAGGPLIGAVAVNVQLRTWLRSLGGSPVTAGEEPVTAGEEPTALTAGRDEASVA